MIVYGTRDSDRARTEERLCRVGDERETDDVATRRGGSGSAGTRPGGGGRGANGRVAS